MLIDLHADTPLWMHWGGYDFCQRHRAWLPGGAWASQVDLPRLSEVGMDAQMFGLVALPMEQDPLGTIHAMIDRLESAARGVEEEFRLLRAPKNFSEFLGRGGCVGLLSIEGVHPLRGKLERAAGLMARGVVSFGLAHFHANEACAPAFGLGADPERGLTPFGKDLVSYLGERGAMIDLAHINRRGFFEVLERAQGPVFVSHTGVSGAHASWRNIDDAQVRAVADRGGVVGVLFARGFVGGRDADAVARHLEHILNIGGEDHPALGSDFDGFVVPVRGLRDVSGLPALREVLRRRGHAQRVIDKIMGENAARFLGQALGHMQSVSVEPNG